MRFVCIGQLTERKGVTQLVSELEEYCLANHQREIELDLIGDGPQREILSTRNYPSNLKVNLLGHLSYEQMSQQLENSGILVFPTLADEWGLVVNEGMQAGLPVLGSVYAQAVTALVRDGENGWQYCPGKKDDLTRALNNIFSVDRSSLLKMRHAAQQTVTHITSENVASKAVHMFKSLQSQV